MSDDSTNQAASLPASPGPADREQVVARYRHLRAVSRRMHNEVCRLIPTSAMLDLTGRLGMRDGRTIVLDNEDELALPTDLAVYTAPPGRTSAIERYARKTSFPPGSDEELILRAKRAARFAVVRVLRRHEAAGIVVEDLYEIFGGGEFWLMDEGLETSMAPEQVLATRVIVPGPFAMTCGTMVPVSLMLMGDMAQAANAWARGDRAAMVTDRRFATTLYRYAILDGITSRYTLREVPEPGAE
jgi:hypothetical protein